MNIGYNQSNLRCWHDESGLDGVCWTPNPNPSVGCIDLLLQAHVDDSNLYMYVQSIPHAQCNLGDLPGMCHILHTQTTQNP